MSRSFHPPIVAALLGAAAASALAAPAVDVPCSVANAGFDAAELVCTIAPADEPRALRFHASFLGVHDDSSAAIGVRLDGQALACGAGSHPRLQGEADGDSISCAIAFGAASTTRELRLQLVWYHAQPSGYTFRSD